MLKIISNMKSNLNCNHSKYERFWLIILFCLNGNIFLFSQYEQIYFPGYPGSGTSFEQGKVDFGDMLTGYSSAYVYFSPSSGGEFWFYQTLDGGATWTQKGSLGAGPSCLNRMLFAVNRDTCFLDYWTEYSDRFYRVSNSGTTWYSYFNSFNIEPRNITKLNDSVLFMTAKNWGLPNGPHSSLYRVEGINLTEIFSVREDSILLLKPLFINSGTGFLISYFPSDTVYAILKTDDTGLSWQSCFTNDSLEITDICFFTQSTGIISCSGGYLFRTSDTGNNWESIKLDTPYGINSLSFIDDNTGYCGGDGGSFYITFDRGQSWNSLNFPFNYSISGLKMMAFNQGYIQTDEGYYRYTDTLVQIKTKTIAPVRIYPNPANSNITIEFSNGSFTSYEFRLINISGNILFSGIRSEDRFTLDLTGCAKGIYFFEIKKEEYHFTRKIILK